MSRAAVLAVCRHEWRRRWGSLVLIGLVTGVLGGLLVAGAGLAHRTATAVDRLTDEVAPGDATVQVFSDHALAEDLSGLPGVRRAWPSQLAVAQLDGPAVIYLGVMSGPERPDDLLQPVVQDGRRPDPAAADEVMVLERAADELGVGPGDTLRISLLTAEEVAQFDVGFGEPDGPTVDLEVVGVGRVPGGVLGDSPLLTTPAFLAAHGEGTTAGTYLQVELEDGAAGLPAYRAAVDDLTDDIVVPEGAEEFPPVQVVAVADGIEPSRSSARVLVVGLVSALVVAAAAGALALSQALARHHAASAADQVVEAALGMTRGERTAARTLPAVAVALLAGVLAATVGLAGAGLDPPGAVGRIEPHPGWLPDPLTLAIGSVGLAVAVLVVAAATAWRAGPSPTRRTASARSLPRRLLPRPSAWALAGSTFALSTGDQRRAVPARAALVGSVLGVAGLVGGLTFGASLDRLVASPPRWGWSGDLMLVDSSDEVEADVLDDPRIEAVTDVRSSAVRIDGTSVTAHAYSPVEGDLTWTPLAGRVPHAADEVMLGSRMAARAGHDVGDRITVGDDRLRVVGIGIGPDSGGEPFGDNVLLTRTALGRLATQQDFRETYVRVADGTDADALAAELGAEHELEVRDVPTPVQDLGELGVLPGLLGGFLALLGTLALVHALAVTTRLRRRDLAVLRALGARPRQAAAAVLATSGTIAAIGLVVGLPLGWATARLVWGEVAASTGVAGDVVVPPSVAVGLVLSVVVAVAVAVVPARKVARARPAEVLRSE